MPEYTYQEGEEVGDCKRSNCDGKVKFTRVGQALADEYVKLYFRANICHCEKCNTEYTARRG